MRLSAWRAAAPHPQAATAKIAAVVDPALLTFGAEPDPHCWVAWGDQPTVRYAILVPTDPGLIHCFVRVIPGEGPRATTKLIRWNRVAIGELAAESQGGRRLLSYQIEGQVLRGIDVEADRIAAFALRVVAAIDGRPLPPFEEAGRRRAGSTPRGRAVARRLTTKSAVAKPSTRALTAKSPDRARPARGS